MAWGFTQGSERGLQLGFGYQVIPRLLSLRDSLPSLFARSFARFSCLGVVLPFRDGLMWNEQQPTNGSSHLYDDADVANIPSTSRSGGSLEGLPAVDVSGEVGISPAIVSLITQTVRAALAAERANTPPSSLAFTPPIPSVLSPSVPSTTTSASALGALDHSSLEAHYNLHSDMNKSSEKKASQKDQSNQISFHV